MKSYPIQFLLAKGRHQSDQSLIFPLVKPDLVHLGSNSGAVTHTITQMAIKQVLTKGRYQELLKWKQPVDLERSILEVEVAESRAGIYPELRLEFDLWWGKLDEEWLWGNVPSMGLQMVGQGIEDLQSRMKDLIQLEFIRNKRLNSIPHLIQSQWIRVEEIRTPSVKLPIYTLSEVERMKEKPGDSWLEKVAHPFRPDADPVFEFDQTVQDMVESMSTPPMSSMLVVGESGRGKSALIHEFVRRISEKKTVRVWEATAAQMLHRLTEGGGWQNSLGHLCKELQTTGDWLYIPDLSELFEVGQYSGNPRSLADYLKPILGRGEIVLITECSPREMAAIERRAPGYLSLFHQVILSENSPEGLQSVVEQVSQHYGESRQVEVMPEAIREILRLQQWFTPYSGLPGTTIRFMKELIKEQAGSGQPSLNVEDVFRRYCKESGLPQAIIDPGSSLDIREVADFFEKNIFGQPEAIRIVLDLLVSIKAAVVRRGKPLGSLLFVGPTGVGKTEMAKVLAQYLFGRRDQMVRFDMSEYQDLPALMRLTGDDGRGEGLLTSAVRQRPFSVILFDELEKVNPLFYDMLLQILGEGRLTSSTGRLADFSSCLIIMTSNLGARSQVGGNVGFVAPKDTKAQSRLHYEKSAQEHFRPELFNRLDRIIPFDPLGQEVMQSIVRRELGLIFRREGIRSRNIAWDIPPATYDYLSERGYNPEYGARHLQRYLQDHWVSPLAKELNEKPFAAELLIEVEVPEDWDNPLVFRVEELEKEVRKEPRDTSLLVRVTRHRRDLQSVETGPAYIHRLNRIEALKSREKYARKREKLEEFWASADGMELAQSMELVSRFESLGKQIVELEEALFIEELAHDFTQKKKELSEWTKEWNSWCRELLILREAGWNEALIGIYGAPRYQIWLVELYLKVLEAGGYSVRARYRWYDESLATEEQPYQKEPLDLNTLKTHTPPIGVEIIVRGELVYPYLWDEAGGHLIIADDGEKLKYHVEVVPYDATRNQVPVDVHRRSFFREIKYRRRFEDFRIVQDEQYRRQKMTNPPTMPTSETLKIWLDDNLKRKMSDLLKK